MSKSLGLSGKTNWSLHRNIIGNFSLTQTGHTLSTNSTFNLLPVSIKVAAQTIGMNLVSVKPMNHPTGTIFGMDFKYGETLEEKRKKKRIERLKKLNKILRKEKLKYIDELLQKIIQ